MKIKQINFINNYFKKSENSKEQNNTHVQFDKFSKNYCTAIKSLNLPFKGRMSKAELKQKCDELKKELLQEGIIQSEDQISWYSDYFANGANITLAKKVFANENLKNCRRDILKTTNEENLPVARYICDNPFPLQYVFDILVATNKENIQASLAMCQSEDIPKDVIFELLRYIKEYNSSVIAKIAHDNDFPKRDKVQSITKLNSYNSAFIEQLLDDKNFPKDNIYYFIDSTRLKEEANAKADFYNYLKDNPNNSGKDINDAVVKVCRYNHDYLKKLYQYFEQDRFMDLAHINIASRGMTNNKTKEKIEIYNALRAQENFNQDELAEILSETNVPQLIESGLKYLRKYPDFPQEIKALFLSDSECLLDVPISEYSDDLFKGAQELSAVYKLLMAKPELYINGEAESKEIAQDEIRCFVKTNFSELINLSNIIGSNAIEQLFRRREEGVSDYLEKLDELEYEYKLLLKKIVNCKKEDGNEFSVSEKLGFVDILAGFSVCNVDVDKIEEKIRDGKINLNDLKKFLLEETFKFFGMSNDEINQIPKEKWNQWNLEYISSLAFQYKKMSQEENDDVLSDLIKVTNGNANFKEYITEDPFYAVANNQTKKMFKKFQLNYDKWFNPPKNCEMQFKYIDLNQERMLQIISQIEQDIETLRKTPAKSFIDKHFTDCIVNEEFRINEKYFKNKQTLEVFTKNMFELLNRNIFSRAQTNLNNPNKRKNAQATLTIKNHLEQRLKDIKQCLNSKKEKPIDLTIKMWDRNPIYDLFQGNYSTCCIALGQANGSAMPHYLLNSAFNMIELVDNNSSETIGNALCYFAVNELNKPMFVIDNIEIANKHKMSNKASSELLNQIIGYCTKLCREVSKHNIPIVMGTSFNDVYDEELPTFEPKKMSLIGKMECNEIYMDAFGGWCDEKYNIKEVYDDENRVKLFCLVNSFSKK